MMRLIHIPRSQYPVIQSLHVSVSHTTEDLVFEWLPEEETPLVVDDGIELPQVTIMIMMMVNPSFYKCMTEFQEGEVSVICRKLF